MITEDYVSFEVAKLLKEKGFDEVCVAAYNCNEENHKIYFALDADYCNSNFMDNCITAPTLQMAMKWLREVHKLIPIILTDENSQDSFYYWFRIDTIKEGKWEDAIYREDEKAFPTYEQACEAAIKYCLENLI